MRIRVIKLRRSDLKGDILGLLERVGLVNNKTNSTSPERILISKQDAATMRRNLKGQDMYWLNFGPSEAAADALKPGYAIVIEGEDEN